MNTLQKTDTRSFQIDFMNVNEFRKKIDETIEEICSEYPEVNPDEIKVLGESDEICMGDYDQEIVVLSFRFKRNLTQEEIDMRNWEKENLKKRQLQSLQKLIRDNFSDALEFIESIGYEVKHKNDPMKIDCADSIVSMFKDEF
jgi:hypothetical protein